MLKNELKRAFYSKGMLFSFVFANALSVYYYMDLFITRSRSRERYKELGLDIYIRMSQDTPFDVWMFSRMSQSIVLFIYFLPIMATLPYAVSYAREKKLDYLKNVALRSNRIRYRICKSVAVFLSGGFVVASSAFINLMLAFTYMKYQMPTPTGKNYISPSTMLGVMYYDHPFVYCMIYIAAIFIFFGCMALTSLIISEITINAFTVVLTPFLILMILNDVLVEERGYYLPMQFLRMSNGGYKLVMVPIVFVAVIFLTAVGFVFMGSRRDVL